MQYLASIVVSAFCLVDVVAFVMQISTYGFVPPAQMVVMVFLLVFTALVWAAQLHRDKADPAQPDSNNLYYRVIADNGVFPIVAFMVQFVIASLYLGAWDQPADNAMGLVFRRVLPTGIFVPLVIELVLAVVVVVLWVGNDKANRHTVAVQQVRQQKVAHNQQIASLVTMAQSHVDESNPAAVANMQFIAQKVSALPLNINPATQIYYDQAVQALQEMSMQSDPASAELVQSVRDNIARVR